jgi:CheY-like chemotaxis protein
MSQPPTLLLIADNPAIGHWIKKHFDGRFFLLEETSGPRTVEVVQSTALDAILIDSELESCEPFSLCTKLHQLSPLVPLLLITGQLKKAYRNRALQAGVTDFLSNQLDVEEFEKCIAEGLQNAAMRKKINDLHLKIRKKL